MSDYRLYWGDSHANIHAHHVPSLDKTLQFARQTIDFLPMAYYPQEKADYGGGFTAEDVLPADKLASDWKTIRDFAARNNEPGRLVIFPGYEWQGDGSSGDHNVSFLRDNPPLLLPQTLRELYAELRARELEAIAIPHHTAYMPGIRGKDWSVHDEKYSPLAEVFSTHGSSEADEELLGLRRNRNMGPGVAGGTIEDGLNRGLKFGIIASNDSHAGLAGVYGIGIMACWSKALTRESIWEAMTSRRAYGVTGDRIELNFTAEGAPMGAEISHRGPVRLACAVRGCDAVDRIELLRNNRVIATHRHNGAWEPPASGTVRFKLRVEAGWVALRRMVPDMPPRDWRCRIDVPDGRIVAIEKCWRTLGQSVGDAGGTSCEFGFHTPQEEDVGELNTQADIFEIESRCDGRLLLDIEGKKQSMTVAEAMAGSRIVTFPEIGRQIARERFGVDPDKLPRIDRMYFIGSKAKLHKAIPESGFTARLEFTDATPPAGTNFYRIRVEQRNGQKAWSSPIWVRNGD